jgi:hypothetical protein
MAGSVFRFVQSLPHSAGEMEASRPWAEGFTKGGLEAPDCPRPATAPAELFFAPQAEGDFLHFGVFIGSPLSGSLRRAYQYLSRPQTARAARPR